LLTNPNEYHEGEHQHVCQWVTLESGGHDVVEVGRGDFSGSVLVGLDRPLDELALDLLVLVAGVVDARVQQLVDFDEAEQRHQHEADVGEGLAGDHGQHGHDEAGGVVDPHEVGQLVEALVEQDALQEDFHGAVGLELGEHLDHVEQQEESELRGVHQIPEVLEVVQALLLELDQLEQEEEDLREEAAGVGHVQEHQVGGREGNHEGQHEPEHVEAEHALQELLGPDELEVDQLPHGLQVVETDLRGVVHIEDARQVLVVEVHSPESFLLHVSDLLSNDNLLEVNHGVFNFNILLTEDLISIRIIILHAPGHVWILFDDFSNDLLLSIMEVGKARLIMILLPMRCEWRQVWVTEELLKVAVLFLVDLPSVDIIHILLSGKVLFIVSLEEGVNPLDLGLLKHLGQVQHHHLLVRL
jgi:hypothetical protein